MEDKLKYIRYSSQHRNTHSLFTTSAGIELALCILGKCSTAELYFQHLLSSMAIVSWSATSSHLKNKLLPWLEQQDVRDGEWCVFWTRPLQKPPWSVLSLEAMLVSVVSGGHAGICVPVCCSRLHWCLISTVCIAAGCHVYGSWYYERTGGHPWAVLPLVAMLMYTPCAASEVHNGVGGLCCDQGPGCRWGPY